MYNVGIIYLWLLIFLNTLYLCLYQFIFLWSKQWPGISYRQLIMLGIYINFFSEFLKIHKGGFRKSWNNRIFKLEGISECNLVSSLSGEAWAEWFSAFFWGTGSSWSGWRQNLVPWLSAQGFFPIFLQLVNLLTHRCSLVKPTSIRYPLESLSAAPYCFPLCCKCKPDRHALSS